MNRNIPVIDDLVYCENDALDHAATEAGHRKYFQSIFRIHTCCCRLKFPTIVSVLDELTVTYSRSSGPGGQNVNKVNTKVDLRFHVKSASWITEEIKSNLLGEVISDWRYNSLTVPSKMISDWRYTSLTVPSKVISDCRYNSLTVPSEVISDWRYNSLTVPSEVISDWRYNSLTVPSKVISNWRYNSLTVPSKNKTRINKDGFLIIRSDKTRYQQLNLADAMERLRELVHAAAEPPGEISPETEEKLRRR
uniref:Large ribosomal subunit protein mL62 n=1 Tax=Timema bartmani TaxID=61472 RepID=A0A7R9I0J7_9NEOP|nr:unnamed protein product [Timema bartmani]